MIFDKEVKGTLEKSSSFSLLGQLDFHMEKKIKTLTLSPSEKATQNGLQTNLKHKIMKLLQTDIRDSLDDLGFGNDLLDITPRA
jgi:hypothetical protein